MTLAAATLLWVTLLAPLPLGLVAMAWPPRHMRTVGLAAGALPLASLWLLTRLGDAGAAGWQGAFALGPLVLHWRLNALAVLLLLLTQLVLLASAAYAVGHRRAALIDDVTHARFWPLLGGLAFALGLIWVAADLLLLYTGLELMGLTAVGMMLLPGTAEAIRAGLRYLLYALVGSLTWLLGVALLLGAWGSLELEALTALAEADAVTRIGMALLTGGLLLKAAIFPLHGWLVPVHASAWTSVSALHGALVVKASFFILIMLWRRLLPDAEAAALILGLLGAAAVLWGGLKACRAETLKQLVAWSTVGQLGYLMLATPLLAGAAAVAMMAWQATWLQLAGHALAKAAMFMAAGNLMLATGASRLEAFAGTHRRLPLTLMTFGLAGVTLMGLPPSAGFSAKWLLLQASLEARQWLWVAVLALGTLLSAAYVFRLLRCSFVEEASGPEVRTLPPGMHLVPLLLALAALGLGLVAQWPLSLLREGGVP